MSGDWITETSADLARELWDQGVSAAEIAKRLGNGATKNAVSGYAHRHGWPMHGSLRARKPDTHGKALAKKPRSHKGKRQAPPPPEPARLPVARVVHRTCQWLEGGDERRSWRFCEAPADPGISYCTTHARRCFVQRRQLKVAA